MKIDKMMLNKVDGEMENMLENYIKLSVYCIAINIVLL